MKTSTCFPGPKKTPILALQPSQSFTQSSSKPFQIEIYWNIESSPTSTKQYLLSLILPIYQDSTSLEELANFLDYYIYGNQSMSKHLMITRDKTSHQIEGFIIVLELQNFYFLENNSSKENSFVVFSGITLIKKGNRRKGITQNMYQIYSHILNKKHLGKNIVFFDVIINPIVYMHICKNYIVYPSYKYFASSRIQEFLVKMSDLFQVKIEDITNPFCVYDGTVIKGIDRDYWMKNYKQMPKDLQFFIDQTKLREGFGVVYLAVGSLLSGNTLEMPPCSYSCEVLSGFDVKECSFYEPKL